MNQPTHRAWSAHPQRARSVDSRRAHDRAIGFRGEGKYLSDVIPRDLLVLVPWLLVFISVSRIHQHFGFLSGMRPALVLLMAGAFLLVFRFNETTTATLNAPPSRFVALVVAAACLSVPFGLSIGNSGKFLLDAYFRMLAVYLFVALVLRGARELQQFVWAYVLGVAVLVWMALFVFDLGQGMGSQMRLNDLYMYDSNDLGVLLIMGIPLTLAVFEASGGVRKIFAAVILFGIGIAIARTGSRGAFVGLLGLGAAFVVWARHISVYRRLGAVAAVVLALVIAAPPGYWEQMNSLKDPTADYNWQAESGRKQLAKRGLGYMLKYPLTGVGVNNFSKAEWQISSMAHEIGRQRGIPGKAAHNTWVQIGAETGVTGLLLWLCLVFGTIWAVARTRRLLPRSWKHGPPDRRLLYALSFYLPLAVWGFAVPSTFVSHAYMDPMYFLAVIAAGYLVVVRRTLSDPGGPEGFYGRP